MAEHGTRARYTKHIRDGDKGNEIDQACREANSANRQAYLASNEEQKLKAQLRSKAASRALIKLKNMHARDYYIILQGELNATFEEAGLTYDSGSSK